MLEFPKFHFMTRQLPWNPSLRPGSYDGCGRGMWTAYKGRSVSADMYPIRNMSHKLDSWT